MNGMFNNYIAVRDTVTNKIIAFIDLRNGNYKTNTSVAIQIDTMPNAYIENGVIVPLETDSLIESACVQTMVNEKCAKQIKETDESVRKINKLKYNEKKYRKIIKSLLDVESKKDGC